MREELEKDKRDAIENFILPPRSAASLVGVTCHSSPSSPYMSIASSENTSNPWAQQPTSVSAHDDTSSARNLAQAKVKLTHVPDDWDNDDEEEETDSQKIWETANTKSPMPQLMISRSSTSATVFSPPPSTLIQAPIRILKRPTPTTPSNNSSVSPSPVPQTLAEREAKYQEARERIFGSSTPSEQDGPTTKTPSPKPVPNVIRNPTGPDTNAPGPNSSTSQGFSGRRGRGPPKS
ncbi:hypothetical protein BDM02DRAFT_3271842 [Thelephora ganbajun]|uniref:Uncharacterized protein n=1 Tax=Thelephora ganbajun TaxID=370292 RepID=A0ACB6Z6Q4_THEGA|nr:hypothetical protein BDM02DRAFT_3271842 [Thelephora ganbajun]